jgi:hypothetical protein
MKRKWGLEAVAAWLQQGTRQKIMTIAYVVVTVVETYKFTDFLKFRYELYVKRKLGKLNNFSTAYFLPTFCNSPRVFSYINSLVWQFTRLYVNLLECYSSFRMSINLPARVAICTCLAISMCI